MVKTTRVAVFVFSVFMAAMLLIGCGDSERQKSNNDNKNKAVATMEPPENKSGTDEEEVFPEDTSKMSEMDGIPSSVYYIDEDNREVHLATLDKDGMYSYFVEQVIVDLVDELKTIGYLEDEAWELIQSGGLKIVATIDPNVQAAMDDVYSNHDNFPNATGSDPAQSAMVVMDPHTGEVKGIVGGIGEKEDRDNRASRSFRQPGSTIKPIAVYAPAMEEGIITAGSTYVDQATDYSGWTPHNYSRTFSNQPVTVREALKRSLNTIPVFILEELGTDDSYDFLTQKLGVTSLVRNEIRSDGYTYSDIGYPQLALGGLTNGISPLELTAAYTPFANNGVYSKPYFIKKVKDRDGNVIIENRPYHINAMNEKTAYIMSRLLNEVLTASGGTGWGAALSSGMYTAGKTGTTSDNNDRWFVGYTPYYVATVWYGYDDPRPISASGNPCISVWSQVMNEINEGKPLITEPVMPDGVVLASYCKTTGCMSSEGCSESEMFWFDENNIPERCNIH